jgi:hypothetical protein
LIRQLRTPGYGKQLATIFLRTQQNASGLSQALLQYPEIRAPHLKGHYYVHIRRFPAKYNASLEIECIPTPTYERQGDEYIMDVVCAPATSTEMDRNHIHYYTDVEIRQMYYCKSYLKVKRISDLCSADGLFVLPSIAKGELSIRQCVSKLEDIRQERPNETNWPIWRKSLRTICKEEKEEATEGSTTTRTAMLPPERHNIGTRITKYWNGILYNGTVISKTKKYYKTQYDDNDEEQVNHKKLKKTWIGTEEKEEQQEK